MDSRCEGNRTTRAHDSASSRQAVWMWSRAAGDKQAATNTRGDGVPRGARLVTASILLQWAPCSLGTPRSQFHRKDREGLLRPDENGPHLVLMRPAPEPYREFSTLLADHHQPA
jgi:hypothetical protein